MRTRLALAAPLAAFAASSLVFAPLALSSTSAQAQGMQRETPRDVSLATIAIDLPPEITLNGKPDRLSPGARIRDLNNMLVLSASLSGKTVHAVYRRDASALVHEVWLLSPEEYQKLSGVAPGAGVQGMQKFIDMLALIFGARR